MGGLTDFSDFFRSFLALVAAGVASTALVLVTAVAGLAPPWPPLIIQITAIAQLLVLVIIYQNFHRAGRNRVNMLMKRGVIALISFFLVYLAAHSLLTFSLPNGELGLRGLFCSEAAIGEYASSCPFLEERQIADATFDDDRLWTPLGILGSRLILLIAWVGSFSSLVFIIATFVVYQRRQNT
ncbi:MAG: hypothetical protein AAFR71_02640 [Pseudomonadota bacterium]